MRGLWYAAAMAGWKVLVALLVGAVLLPAVRAQEVPSALAERVVQTPDGTTRVTLFGNRVVVVSVRPRGEAGRVRRRMLDPETMSVYRTLLEEMEPALRREMAEGNVPAGTAGRLVLRLPGREPLRVSYDPRRVPGLALGRVLAALDDLQTQVLEGPRESEEVARWKPAVGDRVEFWGGGTGVVTDIPQDDVVVIQHEGSPVMESITVRDLPVRVRRVLGPGR